MKSKRFLEENIKPLATTDHSLNSGMNYIDNAKIQEKLHGICLKQKKVTFNNKNILNFYTAHEINLWAPNLDNKF